MTKDEALKLALQLVSNLRTHSWTVADEQLVINAIKEALAQPEQEPVANNWSVFNTGAEVWSELPLDEAVIELTPDRLERGWSAVCVINKDNPPLYTAPPQRKPLTDEEIINEADCFDWGKDCAVRFARAIEAAHGIKGEA